MCIRDRAYPGLKADAQFRELQKALIQLEDDLQNARRYYNAVVRDLNTRVQSFPDLLLARPFGFRNREFFELENPFEAAAPPVSFGTAGGLGSGPASGPASGPESGPASGASGPEFGPAEGSTDREGKAP
ncbi:MAG: LemA family protein, partial [Candidatus Eisenbacteria bacterium]|nr:LemA family protein [Candidatus Eisenbacteria bacterium]